MKILLITQYFPPDLSAGSFRMSSLVNEFKKYMSKNDVLEIYTTFPHRYDNYESDNIIIEKKNIKINRIKLFKHYNSKFVQVLNYFIFFTWVLYKTKNKNYDKIFATSSKLMTSFLGSLIAKRLNIKIYCEFRDNFIQSLDLIGGIYNLTIIKYILNKIESFTCNNCEKLNLVSEGFNSYYISKYPNIKLTNYTNGIDDLFLKYDYTNLNKTHKKIKILYVGNIGFGQGLEKIIPHLAKKTTNIYDYLIIGDGNSKELLQKKIVEFKIHNVKILKPIERKLLKKYYKETDIVFLHLNNHESSKHVLPSKIFEYAATSKPILAGLNGFSKSFCQKNINGCYIFNSSDVDDGLIKLKKIVKFYHDRKSFIDIYRRKNISNNLVKEILKL